jgi:hypothetical protein
MNIKLTVTLDQWNEIMAALRARPPQSAMPVIRALHAQINAQMPDAPKVTGWIPMGYGTRSAP